MTIKAIETTYAGCRFRSRLEARWAVLFDHLKMPWEYEPQGFTFNGYCYLPDFLVNGRTYVEVKGTETVVRDSLTMLDAFATNTSRALILLTTIPTVTTMDYEVPLHGTIKPQGGYSTSYLGIHDGAAKFLRGPEDDGLHITAALYGVRPMPEITAAYDAARSARFEHGESGAAGMATPTTNYSSLQENTDTVSPDLGEYIKKLFDFSPKLPPSVDWCGECDDHLTRLVETADKRLGRCPRCHPLRGMRS